MSTELTHLYHHPNTPCPWADALTVAWDRNPQGFTITYHLSGDLSNLVWPMHDGGQRRDNLWKTTCFEAFFRSQDSDQYIEFNFAPNGDWAAYQFTGYRSDPTRLACAAPVIISTRDQTAAMVRVTLIEDLPLQGDTATLFGPTAVLDDTEGAHSFWALHHALIKPDFHHIETFGITLD
ncbi:MAG: DOMON-like domain-containing protein [Pseudomonadota bacterium]